MLSDDANIIEDADRKMRRLIKAINEVDHMASELAGLIVRIHNLGLHSEAERLRFELEVWHVFGQMSENGPII